jgi:hypothetical protein
VKRDGGSACNSKRCFSELSPSVNVLASNFKTDRQTDRQTDGQRHSHTHTHTHLQQLKNRYNLEPLHCTAIDAIGIRVMAAARNSETTEDMGRKPFTKESVSELFSSSLFFKCMCCLEVHPHKTHSCST